MEKDNKKEGQEQGTGRRNRHSNSFRDEIIRYLHYEKGFSWPKAERGFRAVFARIASGIQCGEVVELPGLGTAKAVRWHRKGVNRVWRPLHNVQTGKSPYRVVPQQRRARRIIFTPHPGLDFTPPPPPAEIEAWRLAAELLRRPVDEAVMYYLQEAVNLHAHRPGALHGPGALLRRLRELKKRGRRFHGVTGLAWALAELYWI